jgi:hypothetical protein
MLRACLTGEKLAKASSVLVNAGGKAMHANYSCPAGYEGKQDPGSSVKICLPQGMDPPAEFINIIQSCVNQQQVGPAPTPSSTGGLSPAEIPSALVLRKILDDQRSGIPPQMKKCITPDMINQEASIISSNGYKFIQGDGNCPPGTDKVNYAPEIDTTLCKPAGSKWQPPENSPVVQQSMQLAQQVKQCFAP